MESKMLKQTIAIILAASLAILPARAEEQRYCKADFGVGLAVGALITAGVMLVVARFGLHKLEDALEKAKKEQDLKAKDCS
jgi:Mn2+/Fe2+ NRAMP family transporter